MRYTTQRRPDRQYNGHIPITVLALDCGHSLTYYGNPEVAEQMVRKNGGSIAGIISRCKECTQRQQALVLENIQRR